MKFVFAGYVVTKDFNTPESWLGRISAYTGILDALAVDHEVVSIEQIDYEGNIVQNKVQYHFVRQRAHTYFPLKLHKYIKAQRPDVVLIHGLLNPLQVIQLRLMLGKNTRIIIQHHAEQPLRGLKKWIQKLADNYVDAYLFASTDLGLAWVNNGNLASPKKIHEVMEVSSVFHPVDKQTARLKTRAAGKPLMLWVARLNETKDPLNVIKAFLRFAAIEPTAKLYMIYHTAHLLPQINSLLSNHPHKNAIQLIGKVPHQELLYWHNSADFILSGSHYEGSGTAICEAISCGCIPIVTDIFSFRMMTNNGRLGILYPPGDEEALVRALMDTRQMDLPAQREKCISYFDKQLSFKAIARRIAEISTALTRK